MSLELTANRTRRNKVYLNDDGSISEIATLTSLRYESLLDSGIYDAEIDCIPQRIDNPQFDGWRITANGWHYALGKDLINHGDQDGWVGFGGRQGAHWFKSRLARVGYLHWPTRAWDDLSGPPNYDRANLSQETHTITIGSNNDLVNVQTLATWRNLWNTPGGGALSISWSATGDHLKEEITINQAARTWIRNNHPPTTPAAETWFGFIFQVDWSDIPKIIRDGLLQSPDSDFADDEHSIELRDSLDRLLAFMPLSYAYVGTGKNRQRVPLRKRFWHDGTHHYLLVGIRVDQLLALPDGDLVFDPTVTPRVSASTDDCLRYGATTCDTGDTEVYIGNDGGYNNNGFRFVLNVPAGATITNATLTFKASATLAADTVRTKIMYEDANDPATFILGDEADFDGRVRSAAEYHWDFATNWADNTSYTTGNFSAVIQALVNEAYWASGEHCVIFLEDDGSDNNAYRKGDSWDGSAADAPMLTVTYSVATTTTTTLAPTTSTTTLAPTTTSTTTLVPTTTSTSTLPPTTTSTTTLAPTTTSTTTLAPTTTSTSTLPPTTTSTSTLPPTTTSTTTSTTLPPVTTTTLRPAPTSPTHEESLSLTINVFKPDFSTGVYEPRGMYVTSLQQEVNSYSHVIKAFGGYWSAKFTILDKQSDMEAWLTNGLGHHIEVYDNALVKIWEGFVNQVDLTLGGLTATRGPLLNVANRVSVVYSGTSTETDPPVQGNRVRTAAVNDLESQGRYGIIEQILSAGGMTQTDAEQARDSYLAENSEPKTIQKLGSGGGLNVSISCLGYAHWFNYLISLVGVEGTINLDVKLGQVLNADPNGLFASSNSDLMPNTLQVPAYDNKSRTAWDVIKESVALGDESDKRYIFGVHADRHVTYQATNQDEVAYRYFPGDPARRIESSTGGNVWPWNVVPGGWMFFPSFLVGRMFSDDWRKDPRFMFVESVTFRLPHTLQLQGGRLDTIPQKLAKMGLAGIGA